MILNSHKKTNFNWLEKSLCHGKRATFTYIGWLIFSPWDCDYRQSMFRQNVTHHTFHRINFLTSKNKNAIERGDIFKSEREEKKNKHHFNGLLFSNNITTEKAIKIVTVSVLQTRVSYSQSYYIKQNQCGS